MSLTLRFWGVRGSLPSPGAGTARYGGNTPCVELTHDGGRVVLDAGTGMRALGEARRVDGSLAGPLDVLVTHAHADHLLGLPFFAALDEPGAAVTVHAAAHVLETVRAAAHALASPPLFPVPLMARAAPVSFAALPLNGVAPTVVAGLHVHAFEALHPGGAAGFRIACPDDERAIVYLPDNELAAADASGARRRALLQAVSGAQLLVHDATYVPTELPLRNGWGHSTYAEAVRFAAEARVPRLALFHHHPERDDAALDRMSQEAKELAREAPHPLDVFMAVEGEALNV